MNPGDILLKIISMLDAKGIEQGISKLGDLQKAAKMPAEAMRSLGLAAGAAGAAITAGLGVAIAKTMAVAGQFDNLSQRTNQSAESLQEWSYAASQAEGDMDALVTGITFLNRSMVEAAQNAKGPQAEAFREAGIAIKDEAGNFRDANTVLLELIDVISKTPDAAKQTALAFDLMGRGATRNMAFFRKGRDEIEGLFRKARETGAIMSGETVAALDATAEAGDALGKQWTALTASLTVQLVPAMNLLVKILEGVGKLLNSSPDWVKGLVAALTVLIAALLTTGGAALLVAGNMAKLKLAFVTLQAFIVGPGLAGLGRVAAFLTGPVGVALVGATALIWLMVKAKEKLNAVMEIGIEADKRSMAIQEKHFQAAQKVSAALKGNKLGTLSREELQAGEKGVKFLMATLNLTQETRDTYQNSLLPAIREALKAREGEYQAAGRLVEIMRKLAHAIKFEVVGGMDEFSTAQLRSYRATLAQALAQKKLSEQQTTDALAQVGAIDQEIQAREDAEKDRVAKAKEAAKKIAEIEKERQEAQTEAWNQAIDDRIAGEERYQAALDTLDAERIATLQAQADWKEQIDQASLDVATEMAAARAALDREEFDAWWELQAQKEEEAKKFADEWRDSVQTLGTDFANLSASLAGGFRFMLDTFTDASLSMEDQMKRIGTAIRDYVIQALIEMAAQLAIMTALNFLSPGLGNIAASAGGQIPGVFGQVANLMGSGQTVVNNYPIASGRGLVMMAQDEMVNYTNRTNNRKQINREAY